MKCLKGEHQTDLWRLEYKKTKVMCCKSTSPWTWEECHKEWGNFLLFTIDCSSGYVKNDAWLSAYKIWCCPKKN
uniref:Uncharacterized protein n=1 Tax=Steinernema glaseri TaxID=37863 RepID=A0A1I7ZJJ6_9BILA